MSSVPRTLALALLLIVPAACGGTITLGQSRPGASPATQAGPDQPPSQSLPSRAPGTTAGSLLALDANTGAMLWSAPVPMAAISEPVAVGGQVFVQGGWDCRSTASILAALDAKSGHPLWQAPTTANRYGFSLCGSESSPQVGPSVVLTNLLSQAASPPFSGTSFVRGLDPRTGRELWTVQGEEPAAGPGVALVLVEAQSGGFKVRGLDPLTGRQGWEAAGTTANITPSVYGQVVMVESYGCQASCTGPNQAGSWITRLDPATGAGLWRVGFGPGSSMNRKLLLGDVAVFNFYVYTEPPTGQPPPQPPYPGAFGALDPGTGAELWRQSLATDMSVPTLAVPGTVYLEQANASSQQCTARLDALDSKTGNLRWRLDNLQACQLEVAADSRAAALLETTHSGTKIVALNPATGRELWEKEIPTAGPYPLAHAAVSAGVIYVSVSGRFILPPPSD